MSELIRRCVAERLARNKAEPTRAEAVLAALAVCGKYEDPGGATRVAEEHDRHVAAEWHPSGPGRAEKPLEVLRRSL